MSKRKIFVFVAFLILAGVGATWADLEPGAPQHQGSALIIYNDLGYGGYEFSTAAMETFRAALDQNNTLIHHPNKPTNITIPSINPKLDMVNILDCRSTNGFDADLKSKFYDKGDIKIDGQNHQGYLFDSLYRAGNPLAYWSQVYDLRFVDKAEINNSVISTSDYSYYKEHLKSGGALYIQAEYNLFTARNNSVLKCINDFTQETGWANSRIGAGTNMNSFTFDNTFENFATDFNNLKDTVAKYPMTWVMAGGYPTSDVLFGHSLVKNGSLSIIICWGTKEMSPEIGNGRLIVSFDINAWGDYKDGTISTGTMAVIQNIYDLMSGTKQFGITKTFSKSQADINDVIKCSITIKNNAFYEIAIPIKDTLSGCFEYMGNANIQPTKNDGNLGGGKRLLEWNINIKGRSQETVSFDVRILRIPPCN